MKNQYGAAMVEFAIVGALFFMVLFGTIEFGRTFFTYNALVEATRRGARVAAVCPISAKGISFVRQITVFKTPTTTNSPLLGLTTNNIRVSYLNSAMNTVASDSAPVESVTDPIYDQIAFVQVSIDQNANAFSHSLFIPFFVRTFNAPPLTTVFPKGSLGRVDDTNPVTKRCCPGSGYTGAITCTP
jgi:Flp pilus assembly protein TadG